MIPGEKFNAIRKRNGKPITVKKFPNGSQRVLAEFTLLKHNAVKGKGDYEGDIAEWLDCDIENRPLPKSGKRDRHYQLFTRFFDFFKVPESVFRKVNNEI